MGRVAASSLCLSMATSMASRTRGSPRAQCQPGFLASASAQGALRFGLRRFRMSRSVAVLIWRTTPIPDHVSAPNRSASATSHTRSISPACSSSIPSSVLPIQRRVTASRYGWPREAQPSYSTLRTAVKWSSSAHSWRTKGPRTGSGWRLYAQAGISSGSRLMWLGKIDLAKRVRKAG